MTTYSFELHFLAQPGEETIDALYEAGWDDALVSWDPDAGGPGMAAFDREADLAVDAVTSAIRQGRSAGIELTGITEDLVALSEVAERVERSFSAVDHWAAGRRGPGDFPEPRVRRPRVSLYSWAEIVMWLYRNGLAQMSAADIEIARVCEVTDAMIRAHRLESNLSTAERRLISRAVA